MPDDELPPELGAALAADPEGDRLFRKLRLSERREWAEEVASAKRPETRVRRAAKVCEILKARVARQADREARGVADLGKRFDEAMRSAVAEVLRPIGFRNARSRAWSRPVAGRVDHIHAHRYQSSHPEHATFGLEAGAEITRLQDFWGDGWWRPNRLSPPLVEVGAGVTVEALRAELVTILLGLVAEVDAVDAESVEGLLAAGLIRSRVLAAFGDLEGARLAFLEELRPPGPLQPPHPIHVEMDREIAERLGLDPSVVPTEPPGGFVDLEVVRAGLRDRFGDRLRSDHLDGEDRLHVRLLGERPDDLAEVLAVTGLPLVLVRVTSVRRALGECLGYSLRLEPVLLERERAIDELVVRVASTSDDQVAVFGFNIDPETEALIRSVVPDDVLVIEEEPFVPYAEALLLKRERLASTS